MNTDLSYRQKKFITDKVFYLNQDDLLFIAKIVEKDTDKYVRKQNNHLFVNMAVLSKPALFEIYQFVEKRYQEYLKQKKDNEFSGVNLVDSAKEKVKLSNYEKSILKKSKYIKDQKEYKLKNQFYKQAQRNHYQDQTISSENQSE